MKLNKLFLTASIFILGLSACNNASKKVEPLVIYEDQGQSTGFPTEVVNTFKETYGFELDIPSVGNETTLWDYEVAADLWSCCYTMLLETEDTGTPGTDALEDAYLAALTQAGVTVDDSDYDYSGYVVLDQDLNIVLQFYTYDGSFNLLAHAYNEETETFPSDYLNRFLAMLKVTADIPAPQNAEGTKWHYAASNASFSAWIEDAGTPGTNAIEDTYKVTLAEAGWTIDDSAYDDEGYYATKGQIEILFYSYFDEFSITIYLLEPQGSSEI